MATNTTEIRENVNKAIQESGFKKSDRGKGIYNAKSDSGRKLKTKTSGNNFMYFVDGFKVYSIPLKKVNIENLKGFLKAEMQV